VDSEGAVDEAAMKKVQHPWPTHAEKEKCLTMLSMRQKLCFVSLSHNTIYF
jgi:hypothetical protein